MALSFKGIINTVRDWFKDVSSSINHAGATDRYNNKDFSGATSKAYDAGLTNVKNSAATKQSGIGNTAKAIKQASSSGSNKSTKSSTKSSISSAAKPVGLAADSGTPTKSIFSDNDTTKKVLSQTTKLILDALNKDKTIHYDFTPIKSALRSFTSQLYVERPEEFDNAPKTYISSTNTPYDMNSIADAVLTALAPIDLKYNRSGLTRKLAERIAYFERDGATIDERLRAVADRIILAPAQVAIDVFFDKNWRPIIERAKEGDIGTGAIESVFNLLTNFGETADITALAVKPLATASLEADIGGKGYSKGELGGKYKRVYITPKDYYLAPVSKDVDPLIKPVIERYINAFGFGDSGRPNYDIEFDTGSKVADILLDFLGEWMADPMNWAEALGKAAVTSAAKVTLDEAASNIDTVVKQVAKDASDEAVEELTKIVSDSFNQARRVYTRELFNKNIKFSDVFNDMIIRNSRKHADLFKSGIGGDIAIVTRTIAAAAQDALAEAVSVPLTTFLKGWDDVQTAVLKGLFTATPGGLVTTGAVKIAKNTIKAINANKVAAVINQVMGEDIDLRTALNQLEYLRTNTKFSDIMAKRVGNRPNVFPAAYNKIVDAKVLKPLSTLQKKLSQMQKAGRTAEDCIKELNAWIAGSYLLPDDVGDLPSMFRYFRQTDNAAVLEQSIKLELAVADLLNTVPDVDGISDVMRALKATLPTTGYTVVPQKNIPYTLTKGGISYAFQRSYAAEFADTYAALDGIRGFELSPQVIEALVSHPVGIEFVYELQKNVQLYGAIGQMIAATGASADVQASVLDTIYKMYSTPVVQLLKQDSESYTNFVQRFFKELQINLYNRTGTRIAISPEEHEQIEQLLRSIIDVRAENWGALKYTHSYSLLPRYGLADAADLRKIAKELESVDANAAQLLHKIADDLIEAVYDTKDISRFFYSNLGLVSTNGVSGLDSIATFCFKNTPGVSVHRAIVDDTLIRFYGDKISASAHTIADMSYYHAFVSQITQEAAAVKNSEYLAKLNSTGVLDALCGGLINAIHKLSDTLQEADFRHITSINYANLSEPEKYALLHVSLTNLFDNFTESVSWLHNIQIKSVGNLRALFHMFDNQSPSDFSNTVKFFCMMLLDPLERFSFEELTEALKGVSSGFAFNVPVVSIRNRVEQVMTDYENFAAAIQSSSDRVRALHSILADTKSNLAAQLGYSREYEMISELLQIQQDAANVLNYDALGDGASMLKKISEATQVGLVNHIASLTDEQLLEYTLLNGRGLVVLSPSNSAVAWREAVYRNAVDIQSIDFAAEEYQRQIQQLQRLGTRHVDGLVIQAIPEHIDDMGHFIPERVYIGLDAAADKSKFTFKPATESSTMFSVSIPKDLAPQNETQQAAIDYIERVSELLAKHTRGASRASNGSVMTIDKAMEIFSKLPPEFTFKVKSVDELAAMGAYKGVLFDGTLLCDNTYAKELCTNMNRLNIDDMVQSVHYAAQVQDAVTSYANAFFSNTSMFRASNLFYGLPKEDAFAAVRNNADAIPVRLVQNLHSSTGMEIVKTDVERIFDNDVILLSRNQYIQMGKIINKFDVSNPFIKFFKNCIMAPLKSGYLHTFGQVMRNIAGALQQNIATSHTFIDAPTWTQSYLQACRAYGKYHDWFVYALEASKELGSEGITQAGFAKMCTDLNLSDADIALYRAVNDFMNSSASGGLLEEAMEVFKGTAKDQDAIDKLSNVLNTAVWDYTIMGRITKSLNSYVEQINRLAKYFYELSYGADIESALGGVIKAQYNYDKISEAAMYLDIVIPFSGFMISNAQLWAEIASENPWAIRLSAELFDATSVYDDHDTSPMDLSNNPSLMYNALVGNPVLENGMTLKMSNTMVEAMKIAMMPFTSISGSLAAPLAMPINWAKDTLNGTPWNAAEWKAQLTQLIPVYGMWAMRYDPTTQYTAFDDEGKMVIVPRGSALKAAQRLGMTFPFAEEDDTTKRLLGLADPKVWSNWDASQTLVMLLPSLFGSTTRKYYFTYDGLKMYSTKDKRAYLDHLADGAQAVYTQQDYDNAFTAYKNIVRYAYQFEGGEVVITDDYNRYLDAVSRGAETVPYTQEELFAKVIAQRVENMRPDEGPAKYAYQYSEGGKIYYTANKDTYDEAIAGGALPVDMTVQEIAALKAAWEQTCKENPVYVFYYDGLRYTTGSKELYQKYIADGAVAGAEDEYKKYIYGFTYGDKVFATTDPAKFKQHLEKGAEAVALTDAEIDRIYAQWNQFYSAETKPTQQKSYNKKSSYKRTYKRTYTRSYKGYRSRAYNTYTRINYNQYNNPSYWRTANASRAKPYRSVTHFYDVYNQVYTRRHSDKFKARMLGFGKTSTGLPLLRSKLRYYIRL